MRAMPESRDQARAEAPAADAADLGGRLEVFPALEVLQILFASGKSGAVVFQVPGLDGGRCEMTPKGIVDASWGSLRGREAALAAITCRSGTFRFDASPVAARSEPPVDVTKLLMDAARLEDELERIATHLPQPFVPLFPAPGRTLPTTDPWECGVREVFALLRLEPGLTLAELEARLPLAPLKVRLSVAWLVSTAHLPMTETPIPASSGAAPFWKRVLAGHPGGLRVVVATNPNEGSAAIEAAFAHLAAALGVAPPPFALTADGPTVVRLRPGAGGLLSLTFVPLLRKHRALFESLVSSVDIVLLFSAGPTSYGAAAEWGSAVPEDVRSLCVTQAPDGSWPLVEAISQALQVSGPSGVFPAVTGPA